MGLVDHGAVVLSISDYSQMGSLEEYLRLAAPGLRISRSAGRAGQGEQGALDMLTIAADSSVLVAAVKMLPEFLRSRKPGTSVTVTIEGDRRELTVTVADADDARQVIERFFDA